MAVAWAIVAFFAVQLLEAIPYFQAILYPLFENPNRSDVEKMQIKWDGIYDWMRFVQQETPDDAVIMLDNTARVEIDLYFLYPRKLIYGGGETFRAHPEIGYVAITDSFPTFPVSGEKIMLDDKHGLYKIQR